MRARYSQRHNGNATSDKMSMWLILTCFVPLNKFNDVNIYF